MKLREDLPRVVVECGNPLKFGYSDFVADYFLWLGLLFVVCDALKTNHFILPDPLQSEISLHYAKLKDFRNSIFHIRPKFDSSEYLALSKNASFLESMNRIHFGLRDWFKEELKRIFLQIGGDSRVAEFFTALSRGEMPERLIEGL